MRHSVLIPAVMAAFVLGAAGPAAAQGPPPLTATLVGTLVDSACYAALGSKAAGADHARCAISCAQRGGRVALVTLTGAVFMVTGALTQENNAKLIPLMNQSVVLTGTVIAVSIEAVSAVADAGDGRRPTGIDGGIIGKSVIRVGDFREGDVKGGVEMTIDAITAALAVTKR
jgi:type 1 fimbria pilin